MVFVCLFADVYIVCVLSEGLLSGFFVVDFCVNIPGKHGATGSEADQNRPLELDQKQFAGSKTESSCSRKLHRPGGVLSGPDPSFHNKNGSGSALVKQHRNSSEKDRTGPLQVNVMWPSSRKFKSDRFRKNTRGPVVADQNRARKFWKTQLGQVCECRGGTVQTGKLRVASKQSEPGQR